MATMIGIYDYYLFTKDDAFMNANWNTFKKALTFITDKIDDSGLLYVTDTDDWGRLGQGKRNTEANMLMYRTLTTSSSLASWMGDSALSKNLSTLAPTLKNAVNINLWDASAGYSSLPRSRTAS
jgi:GH15 family glucan-1,4-alpha-glucosidase